MKAALDLVDAAPAAPAKVFAFGNASGAVRAADAGVSIGEKRIDRDTILPDVIPDVILGPVPERCEFVQAELGVPLDRLDFRTRLALVAANAGDPGIHPL